MDDRPTFGSLFAGIGGLDLGLERAGWRCAWQVELDEFCQRVLRKHWPYVPKWRDVREFPPSGKPADWWDVDLICGGFPCQPASYAGDRRGSGDERWLWPEFARVVRVLRPRFVLVENVPGLLTVNDGRAFGEVLGGLAACGYDAEWDCIPAAAVGAPHLRDRIWLVAYPARSRVEDERVPAKGRPMVADADGGREELADAHRGRLQGWFLGCGGPTAILAAKGYRDRAGIAFGEAWSPEPDVGRLADGIPPVLLERPLAGLGNSVVPQVAEWIGRRLMAAYTAGPINAALGPEARD